MQVEILTPDETLFAGETEMVSLPGSNGSFQILNSHAPLIANLAKGEVRIGEGKSATSFDVKGGLVEVLKNKVVVLV
ncbi:F0F1 ATP synthase subunit epsilon [Bacteroidia bacterium]|jgi:F-type H+-transporting ATPase subunit epsilon|nr:F0F1 ATP synthase subunit epsilon [Bacteroidia bacterium]